MKLWVYLAPSFAVCFIGTFVTAGDLDLVGVVGTATVVWLIAAVIAGRTQKMNKGPQPYFIFSWLVIVAVIFGSMYGAR